MDMTLNNLQRLICKKPKQPTNLISEHNYYYAHTHVYVYFIRIYIYIYIEREREGWRVRSTCVVMVIVSGNGYGGFKPSHANTLGKAMNPTILSPLTGKLKCKLGYLVLVWQLV